MIIIMTMTEIIGPETRIDHTTEIDHIAEKDCKNTIKMIIEMTTEEKIIGISKTRNIRESIEIIMKTHMKTGTTRIIIEIVTKTKIDIKTKTNTEMTVMTKLDVGLKKKVAHMMIEKMIVLNKKMKECTKFYNLWVKKKKW